VSSNKARSYLLSNSRRPPSPTAAEACSPPAVFAHAWYIASRRTLPEARGRACAGAASASYASSRSGSTRQLPLCFYMYMVTRPPLSLSVWLGLAEAHILYILSPQIVTTDIDDSTHTQKMELGHVPPPTPPPPPPHPTPPPSRTSFAALSACVQPGVSASRSGRSEPPAAQPPGNASAMQLPPTTRRKPTPPHRAPARLRPNPEGITSVGALSHRSSHNFL
jgi:hypothetical protein